MEEENKSVNVPMAPVNEVVEKEEEVNTVEKIVEDTKSLITSRTFWINALAIGVGVAGILTQQIEAGMTITVIGFINIVLRVMTTKGINLNK